ncbi:MAG: hypothetical protein QXN55_07900 [Candidatus Nitrosotenuis sp.]
MDEKSNFGATDAKLAKSDVSMGELISYFRVKCRSCGHHRIMHDASGKCEGVMNKPCNSGCDKFIPEL